MLSESDASAQPLISYQRVINTMEQLHEIFILPTGHKRCTGCGEIMLNMTDDHTLVCPDGFLSEISSELLPKDFDPNTLPDGFCPDCEVISL